MKRIIDNIKSFPSGMHALSRSGQALRLNFKSRSGQAAAEMATMGSLILICFSIALTYAQRLEGQQQIKQEAFRRALHKAYNQNTSVSYTIRKDTRFYDLMAGFGQGQPSSLSASASVMWQKGMGGTRDSDDQQSLAYYQINDQMIDTGEGLGLPRIEKKSIGLNGEPNNDFKAPVSVWKEDITRETSYGSKDTKKEAADGIIINTQETELGDKITTKLYTRFDEADADARESVNHPEYNIYGDIDGIDQGVWFNEDTNRVEYKDDYEGAKIYRERIWQTQYGD